LIVPIVGFFTHKDTAAPNTPGQRVRRIIGFALVGVAVSIPFLPVRALGTPSTKATPDHRASKTAVRVGTRCFYNQNTTEFNHCTSTAFPLLWIAGGVAAVGMGIAFWGANRGWLLGMISVVLVVTLFLAWGSFDTSQNMGN